MNVIGLAVERRHADGLAREEGIDIGQMPVPF